MADLDHQYSASLAEYAKMGDSDAFAELYMATCQKQYRFASGYLKDEGLARDAVRDTYVYALRNIAALKDTQLFLSWLNQITFRICLRLEKKKANASGELAVRDCEEPEQQPLEDLEPEESVIFIDGQDFIIRQVMNLPFTESQVILLRYYNGLELRDIARLMDLRTGSVKRHLANGCRKLKHLAGR